MRRGFLLQTAALFAAAGSVAASAEALADDSAMFRGGPAHLGVYDSAAPSLARVVWRFRTGAKVVSSPAVSAGVVYVGSSDDNLYALRAKDGSKVWTFATKGPITSSPAVADGAVFVSSVDGNVYAVDAASGKAKWTLRTGGERRFTAPGIHGMIPRTESMPDPFDVLTSSPAVVDGTVYVGSGDHNVYAIDARTGTVRWKFETGDVVHASPAVAGGVVYVGSWDRYMYALDARSGAVVWKFATGDDRDTYNQVGIAGSAAVSGGTVYFGCRDSHFYALDAAKGTLRWSHDHHGSWVIASPAVAAGVVYYPTSDEKKFYALDASTGAVRFSVPYESFAFSSASVAAGRAFFGTFAGRLYAIDVRNGNVAARFATDASRGAASRYHDRKGEIDLDAAYPDATLDGAVVGLSRIYALGSFVGSPAIAGGVLYVGSGDGSVYAIA